MRMRYHMQGQGHAPSIDAEVGGGWEFRTRTLKSEFRIANHGFTKLAPITSESPFKH